MRIGILTLPLHTNYGGILQAYALQTVLERMGHTVEVFQHERPRTLSWKRKPFAYAKRLVKKYVLQQKHVHIREEEWWNTVAKPVISQFTQRFIDRNIHLRPIDTFSEIRPTDYDAIVVGSDQVWRSIYFKPMFETSIENAYLGFAEGWNLKRVAYAPSFGTDNWEYTAEETVNCGRLLKLFDAVSVREQSAVAICRENFGVDALHVLDPTMLLSAADYIRLFEQEHTPKSCGNLLCYVLDATPEKQQLIETIAGEKNLIPFKVNSLVENRHAPVEQRVQPPIEQWLRGFHDADFVVTDSFHACAFSIIFRKQFVVYGNEGRGMARFHSLLSLFGLEDRLVYNLKQYRELPPIDYTTVEKRLVEMQYHSMSFLQSGLQ